MKPVGARYATKDPGVAIEVAENMLHQALFETAHADIDPEDRTVMAIVKAFREHARNYYRDVEGNETSEVKRIEYATKPLVALYATVAAEEFGIEVAKAATGQAHISTTQIPASRIYGHSNTPGYTRGSVCPGKYFPMAGFKRSL